MIRDISISSKSLIYAMRMNMVINYETRSLNSNIDQRFKVHKSNIKLCYKS